MSCVAVLFQSNFDVQKKSQIAKIYVGGKYETNHLSAWCGCWFVVYIRRFIYKFLNVCPFDYTAIAVSGKVGP